MEEIRLMEQLQAMSARREGVEGRGYRIPSLKGNIILIDIFGWVHTNTDIEAPIIISPIGVESDDSSHQSVRIKMSRMCSPLFRLIATNLHRTVQR
jgi:hypothetical protein